MKTDKVNFQNMNSMIGQDAVFEGNIALEEGIIIYGTVIGNIVTRGAISISKTGKVKGNIKGSDIHIGGIVDGNVLVENRAVLGESSQLNGDLTYKLLIIEEGAKFQGQCTVVDSQSAGHDQNELLNSTADFVLHRDDE